MAIGDSVRFLRRLAPAIMMLGMGCWQLRILNAGSQSFSAAYIHPGDDGRPELTLFPMVGKEITVPLPPGLSSSLTVNAFGPDGKSIYVQGFALDGVWK